MTGTATSGFEYVAVITTYRRSLELEDAIRGVTAQTVPAASIVVVDDGSGEPFESENREIAMRAGATYLQLPHSGLPGLARDRALAGSQAAWIALCDDDDIWDPEHIELLARHVTSGTSMVAGNARRSDSGEPYRKLGSSTGDLISEFPTNPVINSATLIRRESVDGIGGFAEHPRGGEDFTTWLRLGLLGPIIVVDKPTVLYRISSGSLSSVMLTRQRPLPLLCALNTLAWAVSQHLAIGPRTARYAMTIARRMLLREQRLVMKDAGRTDRSKSQPRIR